MEDSGSWVSKAALSAELAKGLTGESGNEYGYVLKESPGDDVVNVGSGSVARFILNSAQKEQQRRTLSFLFILLL